MFKKWKKKQTEKKKLEEWSYIEYLESRIVKLRNRNNEMYNWCCELQNEITN